MARMAVIGAGMAGSVCARFLTDAGMAVSLFDKSRGPGGRMSTRRAEWAAPDGLLHQARFDHGAPGFTAHSPEFIRFIQKFSAQGLLSSWTPRVAPGSRSFDTDFAWWVASPDMPSWCRALCTGLKLRTECLIDSLQRSADGRWQLQSSGSPVASGFDAVIIAIPPLQAAPLLAPHQAQWSERAQSLTLSPVWVLMSITDDISAQSLPWDLIRPPSGAIDLLLRNDAKPGRDRLPAVAHWVAHATPAWSQEHLEWPASEVQLALQKALSDAVASPLKYFHTAVHRWRYASVPTHFKPSPPNSFWWDANLGLGVCGDALGGSGVEGAWYSAQSLAQCLLREAPKEDERDLS